MTLLAGGIGMYRLLDRPYQLPLVIGAVPYWDLDNSARSVSNHPHIIDKATPWWYGLTTTDGSVVSQLPTGDATAQTLTRLHTTGVRLMPTGGVELGRLGAEDPALRAPPADRHRTPS
jgi:hypothetical protein